MSEDTHIRPTGLSQESRNVLTARDIEELHSDVAALKARVDAMQAERNKAIMWALLTLGAAAFAAPDPDSGTIRAVLLVELRRNGSEQDYAAIRLAAARRKLPLGPVIFVNPGQITITRNGKISRARTRERFLAGEIPHAWS